MKTLLEHAADGNPYAICLHWLQACLNCPTYHWDEDQKEAAQESLDQAIKALESEQFAEIIFGEGWAAN